MNPLKGKNFKKILTRASKGLKGLNPKFKNFGKRHINSEGKWQVTALKAGISSVLPYLEA